MGILLACLFFPVSGLAVSLGDALVLSRLGDPVEIEIEVLQWEDLDLERVEISPASREEYDLFQLTWLPLLDELSFNMVGPNAAGEVRVLISSRNPHYEPYLELLLALRWPGGSLRREYVLLFDPPGLAPPLPQVSASDAVPASATDTDEAAPVSAAEALVPAAPAPTRPVVETTPARRSYPVRTGDSLEDIARQFMPAGSGENLFQMLLSLFALNPDAFLEGNISRLRTNAVLQIPAPQDIAAIDPATAQALFEQRWAEGTAQFQAVLNSAAQPLFEPAANPAAPAPVQPEAEVPGEEGGPAQAEQGLILATNSNVLQPLPLPAPTLGEPIAAPDPPLIAVADLGNTTVRDTPVGQTRTERAAELEAQVAAMRELREEAEAVARTFEVALQAARANRASPGAFGGITNLLLAAAALFLSLGLLAASAGVLHVWGQLRSLAKLQGELPSQGQIR